MSERAPSAIVVDASAFAAVLFKEPEGDWLADLWVNAIVVAPVLLCYEIANVALTKARRAPDEASACIEAYDIFLHAKIQFAEIGFQDALALAQRWNLTIYDASYAFRLIRSLGPCHSRQAEGLTGNPEPIHERWFCSGFPIARFARVGNDIRAVQTDVVSYHIRLNGSLGHRHCEEAQPTKQSRAASRLWIASPSARNDGARTDQPDFVSYAWLALSRGLDLISLDKKLAAAFEAEREAAQKA